MRVYVLLLQEHHNNGRHHHRHHPHHHPIDLRAGPMPAGLGNRPELGSSLRLSVYGYSLGCFGFWGSWVQRFGIQGLGVQGVGLTALSSVSVVILNRWVHVDVYTNIFQMLNEPCEPSTHQNPGL